MPKANIRSIEPIDGNEMIATLDSLMPFAYRGRFLYTRSLTVQKGISFRTSVSVIPGWVHWQDAMRLRLSETAIATLEQACGHRLP